MATYSRKTRILLTPLGIIIFSLIITAILIAAQLCDKLLHLPRFESYMGGSVRSAEAYDIPG